MSRIEWVFLTGLVLSAVFMLLGVLLLWVSMWVRVYG